MRRRTNKSSRVPNVKLRPALARTLSRAISEHCLVEDSQAGSDDTAFADPCPRPFRNVVICATGVKDKPTIFKQASELGATSVSAFTDRVTHLIAESHGGPKYMCALERKIPIMKASWVEESYQTWLHGGDVDLQESVETHRLPIFSGVVLCLSGITDVDRRVEINRLVTRNGGTYVKNLERPVKVTHLLCSGDEETDKMRYAEKFNQRKEAVIHLLWEEWFWDSLDFGGRFEEGRYVVTRPRPERKALPEVASSPPPSEFYSEMDDAFSAPPAAPKQLPSSSNQDGEDEVVSVRIVPAVTLQIWGSLLRRRGYQVAGAELVRTTSAPAVFHQSKEESTEFELGKSVISAFRRASSFATTKIVESEGIDTSRQPFRRTSTNANIFVKSTTPMPGIPEKNGESSASALVEPVAGPSSPHPTMFAGHTFRALGEAKTAAVKNAVESYGGRMVSEQDDDVDFIIVRLVSGSKLYREEADLVLRSKYRTECWLERCIFEDRICAPDQDIAFRPLAIETPIPDAEKVIMSLSGFDTSESCGLRRLFRALGITLAHRFSQQTTHLLCPSATGPKYAKACEWGIPVVKLSWLATMASAGIVPSVDEHLVPGSTVATKMIPRPDFGVPMEMDSASKGKAKAVPQDLPPLELGTTMNDITNTDSPEVPVELCEPANSTSHARQSVRLQTSHSSSSSSPSSASFGQPKFLRTPTRAPSLASVPPQSAYLSSASPIPLHIRQSIQEESITQSDYGNNNNSIAHKPTWQELEHDRQTTQIPSSKTPSPMKLVKTSSGSSISPAKIDHEVTKALQESIARALKRHTSEDDDVLNGGRTSKRQRPQRRKAPTRHTSKQELQAEADSLIPFAAVPISPFESFDIVESDMLPVIEPGASSKKGGSRQVGGRRTRSSVGNNNTGASEEDETMRVMYEDPALADERKKLMELLKTQSQGKSQDSQSKTVKTTQSVRKGTRIRKSTKSS